MGFAILRTQKLKNKASISRSFKHAFREQNTPNADPKRTPENSHLGAHSSRSAMQKLEQQLPEKIRKNAVLAIEYLVTASPDDMHAKNTSEQNQYFSDALRWLQDRHGKKNVVYAGVHRDEKTPHMYAYVVPLDEKNNLNCRKFLGGSQALSQMQTDFAKHVGLKHDLERGIQGSKARHQSVKKYYAAIENGSKSHLDLKASALEPRQLEAKGIAEKIGLAKRTESPEMIAARICKGVNDGFSGTVAEAARSSENARKAKQAENTALSLRNRLQPVLEALEPLNHENQIFAVKKFKEMGEKLLTHQNQERAKKREFKIHRDKLNESKNDREKSRFREPSL